MQLKSRYRSSLRLTTARWVGLTGSVLAVACSQDAGEKAPGRLGSGSRAAEGEGGSGAGADTHLGDSGSGGALPQSPDEPPARLLRYLGSGADPSIRFELDSVSGLEPYATSVAYLRDKFSALLEKPDGISFETGESLEPAGSEFEWTFELLDDYARAHAQDDAETPVTIQVLSLDGRYAGEGSGSVLGLAWDHRFIALFQDAIRSPCASGVLGALQAENCEAAERNVWAHEVGHVIGLVDNGVPMTVDHRDSEHGRHDVSGECLMYWAYDGPQVFDALLGRLDTGDSPDLEFCARCLADIAALR